MNQARVLLVDDDPGGLHALLQLLSAAASCSDVAIAGSGSEALRLLARLRPHVLVAALTLGRGPGGSELCRRVREAPLLRHMGIAVFAQERASRGDDLAASVGADLCLARQDLLQVLPGKISWLLDRAHERLGARLRHGELLVCTEGERAWVGSRPLRLTPLEFQVLSILLADPEPVHSAHELLSIAYQRLGRNEGTLAERVAVARIKLVVHRIRTKLGTEHSDLIQCVRRRGYRIRLARSEC